MDGKEVFFLRFLPFCFSLWRRFSFIFFHGFFPFSGDEWRWKNYDTKGEKEKKKLWAWFEDDPPVGNVCVNDVNIKVDWKLCQCWRYFMTFLTFWWLWGEHCLITKIDPKTVEEASVRINVVFITKPKVFYYFFEVYRV